MASPIQSIAVIVSCFNRKPTTLAGLDSLFQQQHVEGLEIEVFLVDDASTDGTSAAVVERFPAVRLLHGNGDLWWVGAMRLAFAAAMQQGFDAYLWWNDDTVLTPDSVSRLVACAQSLPGPAIVVGSTCDATTGERTYGGWKRRLEGLKLIFDPVQPSDDKPLPIDAMNGNCVLIPAVVANKVGNLEPRFRHRLADMDYSQRAVKAGFALMMVPGYIGTCRHNSDANSWRDETLSRAARWKDLMSPRGSDPKEWLLYTTRHYGWRWPLYFASPYVKVLFSL